MKPNKPEIIPYYKYKQQAFWKFNNALASLIHRNGGMSDPFGGRIDDKTRFDFVIYLRDGNLTTVSVRQSLFPVGFLQRRRLSDGSLSWVICKFKSNHTEVEILSLDLKTKSLLEEFLKTFSKLPSEISKLKIYYGTVTVLHDSLCYSVYQDGGASLKFSSKL